MQSHINKIFDATKRGKLNVRVRVWTAPMLWTTLWTTESRSNYNLATYNVVGQPYLENVVKALFIDPNYTTLAKLLKKLAIRKRKKVKNEFDYFCFETQIHFLVFQFEPTKRFNFLLPKQNLISIQKPNLLFLNFVMDSNENTEKTKINKWRVV